LKSVKVTNYFNKLSRPQQLQFNQIQNKIKTFLKAKIQGNTTNKNPKWSTPDYKTIKNRLSFDINTINKNK